MRILMLNYEFPPIGGGAGNAMYYLLKEFSSLKDVHIDVITSTMAVADEAVVFSPRITIHHLAIRKKSPQEWRPSEIVRWTLRAYACARRLAGKNSYDVCHCWGGWPAGIVGYLNWKRVPYLISLRGSDVPGHNPRLRIADALLFRTISRMVWTKAHRVLANSYGLRREALRTCSVPISIITNGVDTTMFRPVVKRSRHDGQLRLLYVGRLAQNKGIMLFLAALRGLKNTSAVVVGDGPLYQRAMSFAKNHHLNVTLTGQLPIKEVLRHYQYSDLFVLPSASEGMSNAVLEAMACGLPIICTNVGGSKELIKDNGIVLRKRSVRELQEAIVSFQKDPDRLSRSSSQSRKVALSLSWRKCAADHMKVFT